MNKNNLPPANNLDISYFYLQLFGIIVELHKLTSNLEYVALSVEYNNPFAYIFSNGVRYIE